MNPSYGYAYRAAGGAPAALWDIYTLIALPGALFYWVGLACSIGILIYVWTLGRNNEKVKHSDVRGAIRHLNQEIHRTGHYQQQVRQQSMEKTIDEDYTNNLPPAAPQ